MTAMTSRVVVVGSFVVDCAFRAGRAPRPGETLIGSGFALGCGGKGSNQAVAARRAGAEVTLLSAVGADAFGEMGRQLWAREGIDASGVRTRSVATGAAAILLDDATGENAIVVVPGACGTLTAADVEACHDVITQASVLLVQLEVPVAAVQRALEIAHAAGVMTVLNPAPAPSSGLSSEVLSLVDYLIPNETEIESLAGRSVRSQEDAVRAARILQQSGARDVIVTLGGEGAVLVHADGTEHAIAPFEAGPVVDTTGAGDAFCGAFAVALSDGFSPAKAARFASAAAAISVTRHGTAASTPRRAEVEALLQPSDHR